MAIDDSILTLTILMLCIIVFCFRTYRKTRNALRTFFVFLWVIAIYFVTSCCIFPIQFTNTGVHMQSFKSQFSMMSFEQLQTYFLDYFLFRISYFASFLVLAFVACILFETQRKIINACILLICIMSVHLVYNVGLNLLIDEVVKSINAEDFLIMFLGFISGWICAKITIWVCPSLGIMVLKKRGD